jgi:L-threonylcarbamoyladenylate synthase
VGIRHTGEMPTLRTRSVEQAVGALRAGGLVGLPTETVYGLGADALNTDAVRRIFEVKGRPRTHPVIVHCAAAEHADAWGHIPSWAHPLVEKYWPGPLTLVLNVRNPVDHLTGGQPTIGIRVPGHALTLEVLTRFGSGVAAPSANRFGRVSPTSAQDVVDELGDRLDPERDRVLDGGRCPVGIESTIVDATTSSPRILRAGAVTEEQVARATGLSVHNADGTIRVPGSLSAHYSPRAPVHVVEAAEVVQRLNSYADAPGTATGVIALENVPVPPSAHLVSLARPADTTEYARVLYRALREADERGVTSVLAVLPPDTGVGRAVRDRLLRASSPSPAT